MKKKYIGLSVEVIKWNAEDILSVSNVDDSQIIIGEEVFFN